MTKLTSIIYILLRWIESFFRKKDEKERQEKRDEARDDPGSAFANHFNRMSEPRADAPEADETHSQR